MFTPGTTRRPTSGTQRRDDDRRARLAEEATESAACDARGCPSCDPLADPAVLVASIWNFESLRSAVLAGNPSATWGSLCGVFFNASPENRALIMNRVEQYNAVLETECATYANCLFDGYALFSHEWSPAEVSTADNFHPSVAGNEMMSEVLYNAGYTWAATPTDINACKNSAWKSLVDSQGQSFKNQGDCLRYVTTGGTPAGV
jgi:hypothetical protein